ncbi:twitching motility protein PilT [Corynebacterium sp. CNJ-954]|uniref:type II toxin-antitoxin system VapC family toxin n=1 Tax=Corynebacterium sp. CNJ-954 TaxID=1904962 RepID=UPI000961B947|nr:type II toxin-antitoxin system VapC family toxin [Corynebacterium sp. CNJ-954]OLT51896.1 twitching motility protein PilT [Corynebacterium sp. CNJ-954]
MRYLLDTNVLSELRRSPRRADPSVRHWIAAQRPTDLYISVITVMELELGVRRVERRDIVQGRRLRNWLDDDVMDVFTSRTLEIDVDTAVRTATLHVPDPAPERDALIAATALVHGLAVATRNTRDFTPTGVPLVNPWEQ